jgi:hypothetical protein
MKQRYNNIHIDYQNPNQLQQTLFFKLKVYTGKNVYGILRASRGASTECLVISSPYRPPDSVFTGTYAGIAIMLSLAASFRSIVIMQHII